MEKFVMIDAMSVNGDQYFREDGTLTKDKSKAMAFNSIEEGQDKARYFTLYQPVYEPIHSK